MKRKPEEKKVITEDEKDMDLETIKKMIRKKEIQTTVLKKIIQQGGLIVGSSNSSYVKWNK